jgi:orotate phosphoribosyltransferase
MEIENILLDCKAVLLRPRDPLTYTSGLKGPIYCDNRLLISYPEQREKIVETFLNVISQLDFDVIGGTATAGIPWAAFLAQKLRKPMIYIRGKAKGHGKGNQIEGTFTSGQRVLIVEDLITTAGSVVNAIETVRLKGGIVEDVVALFTHELASGLECIDNAKCNLHVLGRFSTLITLALEKGIISEDEKKIMEEWNKDPKGWTP